MNARENGSRDLWLRYLDWTATQVNKRLLEMSVDDLWSIANVQSASSTTDTGVLPVELLPSDANSVDLIQLVRHATLSIARTLDLPDFSAWQDAYAEDPARFDSDITGISSASSQSALEERPASI